MLSWAGFGWSLTAHLKVVDRIVDEARLEVWRLTHEAAGCDNLIDDKPGLIGCELEALFFDEFVHNGVEDAFWEGETLPYALFLKDAFEQLNAWPGNLDFVGQAAQECGVHQVFRIEVCGEDHHLLEGDREALAGVQFQVVDAALEGHDPAIEQVGRAYQLAAKVIDDEASAQGLHVERSLVEIGCGVVPQIEHLQRQFAASDDERPAAGNPTRVVFLAAHEGDPAFLA